MTEARGEAVHVCARILLKYTLNVDEENKVGGKLTVYLFVLGNIEFVLTMLGLCCSLEVARTSGLQSPISC